MFDLIFTMMAFFILVGIIITIHEGGHFLIGRLVGLKILEFSIGFGPIVYQNKLGKKDKFIFTLRLLPLGGFVRPLDKKSTKEEEWNSLTSEEQSREYQKVSNPRKFLMVLAGPVSNFVLALIIYMSLNLFVGSSGIEPKIKEIIPQSVASKVDLKKDDVILGINNKSVNFLSEVYPILSNTVLNQENVLIKTQRNEINLNYNDIDLKTFNHDISLLMGFYFYGTVGDVKISKVNDGAGKVSGLKEGDIIKEFDGEKIEDLNTLIRKININYNKEVEILVLRNNDFLKIKAIPELKYEANNAIGKLSIELSTINPVNIKEVNFTILDSITNAFIKTKDSIYTTTKSLYNLLVGKLSIKSISGPISIADIAGKSLQRGFVYYLNVMAAISIGIGVFNLMPLPVLDGGHLLIFTIEGIINRKLSDNIFKFLNYTGFVIMILFFTLALVTDIMKYI